MGLSNPIHIAFVLMLLLLVFGAKRLPEMGRSLGSGMRGFKDSLAGEGDQQAPDPQPREATAPETPVLLASTPTPTPTPAPTPAAGAALVSFPEPAEAPARPAA
jgi:sec-independent protein translocase protein TatA